MIVRSIPSRPQSVFLTFDDGPDPLGTPQVLDILSRHKAKATFFVIGEKALKHPDLIARILREGHALGNHSWDHRYINYWRGAGAILEWKKRTEDEFSRMGWGAPVAFRSPAGVVNPPLRKALGDEPLVLWNERFYDTVFAWSEKRARRSAESLRPGSIVLLHDRQKATRLPGFCKTLDAYLTALKSRSFACEALTRELCQEAGSTVGQ